MIRITPNFLTLSRLIISPLLLPFLIVYGFVSPYAMIRMSVVATFLLLCLTDFFDGYLARKHNLQSSFGRVLDPIADKFLLYSTLIGLVAVQKIYFYWSVIWIGREFFMLSLRAFALEHNVEIPVSGWGKMKTAFQFLSLGYVMINPYNLMSFSSAYVANSIQVLALLGTSWLVIYSSYLYYQTFLTAYHAETDNNCGMLMEIEDIL